MCPPPLLMGPSAFVLIMMLVAVTDPLLFLVPCTPMKSPTLRALEVELPDMVRNVVEDENVTVCDVVPRVVMVMVSPESAVIFPPVVGRPIPAGGFPCWPPVGAELLGVVAPAAAPPRPKATARIPPPTRARRELAHRHREA